MDEQIQKYRNLANSRNLIPVTSASYYPDSNIPQEHFDEFLSHGFQVFQINYGAFQGDYKSESYDPHFEIHQNGHNILSNPSVVSLSGLSVSIYEVIGPRIGTPATVIFYSDRRAATVTEILYTKNGKIKGIRVRRDHATRTDNNGMSDSQSYTYSNYGEGPEYEARLVIPKKPIDNKLGDYGLYVNGPVKDWSYKIVVGYRREYHDYCY